MIYFPLFTHLTIIVNLYILLILTSTWTNADCLNSPNNMKNFLRYSTKRTLKNSEPKVTAVLMACPETSTVPTCRRKIVVNIDSIAEEDQEFDGKQKYLLVDELFDSEEHSRARLMSPYLIELTHGEPVLMYPLEFDQKIDCNSPAKKRSDAPEVMLEHGKRATGSTYDQPKSVTNDDDLTVNIDIGVQDENIALVPNRNMNSQSRNHDSMKRHGESFIASANSNEELSDHSFDAIFNQLEQQNEQIQKDIIEILKPTFELDGKENIETLSNAEEESKDIAEVENSKRSDKAEKSFEANQGMPDEAEHMINSDAIASPDNISPSLLQQIDISNDRKPSSIQRRHKSNSLISNKSAMSKKTIIPLKNNVNYPYVPAKLDSLYTSTTNDRTRSFENSLKTLPAKSNRPPNYVDIDSVLSSLGHDLKNDGRLIEIQYRGQPGSPIEHEFIKVDDALKYDDDKKSFREFSHNNKNGKNMAAERFTSSKENPLYRSPVKFGASRAKESKPSKENGEFGGEQVVLRNRQESMRQPLKYGMSFRKEVGNQDQILRNYDRTNGNMLSMKNIQAEKCQYGDECNEENTMNLNSFPYIVAQRPLTEFQRAYQQQPEDQQQSVWFPDMGVVAASPIESENQLPEYLENNYEQNGKIIPSRRGFQNDRTLFYHQNPKKKRSVSFDDMEIRDMDLQEFAPSRHLPMLNRIHSENQLTDKHKKSYTPTVEDIWYSVFNMTAPLPFLTIRVRIFRKKENSWWRIAPSITLTSLSGTYANANLSIMFSLKTDIQNIVNLPNLQNFKLLIPNGQTNNIDPNKVLPIRSETLNFDKICGKRTRNADNSAKTETSLANLGHIPSSMNILEKCRNDANHFCFNMLQETGPKFRVNIEIPFHDNDLVYKDNFKVRITDIIVDATTEGVVEVLITIISESLSIQEFDIVIKECPIVVKKENQVHIIASPYRSATVSFLLPFSQNDKSQHKCEVQVVNSNQIVARRQMRIQSGSRCFCIWECHCHCIKEFVSTLVSNMCVELTSTEEEEAGFEKNDSYEVTRKIILVLLALLLILLIIGCIRAIRKCKMSFDESSPRCGKCLQMALFFIMCPCIYLCDRFKPTEDDLLETHPDWSYSVVQKTIDSSSFDMLDDYDGNESDVLYTQEETRSKAGADQRSAAHRKAYANSVQDYLCDDYEDDEGREDAQYVFQILQESRSEILNADHCSEELISNNQTDQEAMKFVRNLIESKIVYRVFTRPIGNVCVPAGQPYTIRGYFIPAIGTGYQFITHTPLRQHWRVCPEMNCLQPIVPPTLLQSKDFSRMYANKLEVFEAKDLSISPSRMAPCINVLVQDVSMYVRSEDDGVTDNSEEDE